jgi:hypothetical protein
MALIEQVRQVCARLAPHGWAELFSLHGLDITADDLETELGRPLSGIRRDVQGFEDFAAEGSRGIEPGQPARSLLYHALASPGVVEGPGIPRLEKFPTLAELDVVENYVFAARRVSLQELRTQVGDRPLAVVVFSSEYRTSPHTAHRRHADLVFSRCGLSRVGTAEPLYHYRFRGFVPQVDENPFAFRVSPARFSAFLAVKMKGDKSNFLPMRFFGKKTVEHPFPPDDSLDFWQPVHKLFSGPECLTDFPELSLSFEAHHINEKLRRVHLALGRNFDTGWKGADLDNKPFRFSDGLAELSTSPEFPPGVLVPVPHPSLVEPASYEGKPLTYNVPPNASVLSSSLRVPSGSGGARSAPEYVHARTRVEADGSFKDLNSVEDVANEVRRGEYKALHYVDYTGDGWVSASCPQTRAAGLPEVAAYSLVTAPDFFVSYSQRELTEWTEGLPKELRDRIWRTPPDALSDQRLAANVTIPGAPFDKDDISRTALVSLFGKVSPHNTRPVSVELQRHSYLPDHAAGVFFPGWDISFDVTDDVPHMAAYGLGSPFPEDTKLCAALSTFWPAAAPDATRTFTYASDGSTYFTVAPLSDEEIGQHGSRLPWDGEPGPRLISDGGKRYAEFESFNHTDYVLNTLEKKFSLRLTSHIDGREYENRVLAMVLAYRAVGADTPQRKNKFVVLSFRSVVAGDAELQHAQVQAHTTLPFLSYRFEIFPAEKSEQSPTDFRKRRVEVKALHTIFVDPRSRRVLHKLDDGAWTMLQVGPLVS